jgi:hypothetical protein
MKVKLNPWLGYEEWLNERLVFEFDSVEISLGRPGHYGGRRVLAHILAIETELRMNSKDIERVCSLLSEPKSKNKNRKRGR